LSERSLRWTRAAIDDLARLYEFLAREDIETAERALVTIRKALELLKTLPYLCRKVGPDPTLREMVISFGSRGYVALYRIKSRYISILAVRHQREDDFH
jgi:plasmid stabilization system protein ParE